MRKYLTKTNLLHLLTLLIIITGTAICSIYFYQLALINGESMSPAYNGLEFVIIDKTSDVYERGEVIALGSNAAKGNLIKRIAAKEYDTIIILDGTLYVNGEEIPYFHSIEYAGIAENEITLKEGEYFVIGDNTKESRDSRYAEIGIIKREDIIGRIIPQR